MTARLGWQPPVSPRILTLEPYAASDALEADEGNGGLVHLASNENPLGPSPRALVALNQRLSRSHRYPDGSQRSLKGALADRLACSPAEISVGQGSNELIDRLFRILGSRGGGVVAPAFSFAAYRLCAELAGCRYVESRVGADFAVDVDALLAAVDQDTRLVAIANPNNPTGAVLGTDGLAHVARALLARRIPLLIDYAYWEYAGGDVPDPMTAYRWFPNVIVLRTFSKAHGLAALRVGYAVADPEIVSLLEKGRQPFNVAGPALAAAQAALEDEAHLRRSVELNRAGRAWLADRLAGLGLTVHAGPANFLLVDTERPAASLCRRLAERGVYVRSMDAYGLPTCFRTSVGLPHENETLIESLGGLLEDDPA